MNRLMTVSSLLLCGCYIPAAPGVAQNVGTAGGTLAFSGATLTVPPGALREETELTITTTTAPSSLAPYSPLYVFGPNGLTFEKPARVSMKLSQAPQGLAIHWAADGGYTPLNTTVAELAASAEVTTLGTAYAGFQRPAESLEVSLPAGDGGQPVARSYRYECADSPRGWNSSNDEFSVEVNTFYGDVNGNDCAPPRDVELMLTIRLRGFASAGGPPPGRYDLTRVETARFASVSLQVREKTGAQGSSGFNSTTTESNAAQVMPGARGVLVITPTDIVVDPTASGGQLPSSLFRLELIDVTLPAGPQSMGPAEVRIPKATLYF